MRAGVSQPSPFDLFKPPSGHFGTCHTTPPGATPRDPGVDGLVGFCRPPLSKRPADGRGQSAPARRGTAQQPATSRVALRLCKLDHLLSPVLAWCNGLAA